MAIFHNNIPSEQTPAVSAEQELRYFEAACFYLSGKEPGYAYICLEKISKKSVGVLFNKALCCYMIEWYEECYNLLDEAERLLPTPPLAQGVPLPPQFSHWNGQEDLHLCAMPPSIPDELAIRQVLCLKAEAAFHLGLPGEVKRIAGKLQKPCSRINHLVNKIK